MEETESQVIALTKQVRLFYLFRLLATSYFYVPVFFFYKLSRGLSWEEIFVLSSIYSVTVILFEVPTGAFADRIGRRASMMAGSVAMVASSLVAFWATSFPIFAVAELLAALSITLCSGADSAYLYDLLVAKGQSAEYAQKEANATSVNLLGRAVACLAGGLLATIDLALPYLATACSAGLALVVAFSMKGRGGSWVTGLHRRIDSPGRELRLYGRHMMAACRLVWTDKALLWIVFYSALVFALFVAAEYVYQPFLDGLDFGVVAIGAVYSGMYLGSALSALGIVRLTHRLGARVLVWFLLLLVTATFLLLNLSLTVPLVLAVIACQALARGMFSPLVKTLLNHKVRDSQRRATVLSVEGIARRLTSSGLQLGLGAVGAGGALYLCGGMGVFGFVMLALWFRQGPPKRAAIDTEAASLETAAPWPKDSHPSEKASTSSPLAAPKTESTVN